MTNIGCSLSIWHSNIPEASSARKHDHLSIFALNNERMACYWLIACVDRMKLYLFTLSVIPLTLGPTNAVQCSVFFFLFLSSHSISTIRNCVLLSNFSTGDFTFILVFFAITVQLWFIGMVIDRYAISKCKYRRYSLTLSQFWMLFRLDRYREKFISNPTSFFHA